MNTADVRGCPRLSDRHLAHSRVLGDRTDVLSRVPKGGVIVEVGVALGTFSELLVKVCEPTHFIAIDLFRIHQLDSLWGQKTADIFAGQTHAAYYAGRMAGVADGTRLSILEGDSLDQLATLADRSVDIFYVDADHSYESCSRELAIIKSKVKDDGLIWLNDYVMFDMMGTGEPYGVIQATHEFMIAEDYEMVFLALQPHMYCDVVIRKIRD